MRHRVAPDDPATAVDLLAALSGLSKSAVKDAMTKGAVWWRRGRGRRVRLRRAKARVRPGDALELFHDPVLLSRTAPTATLLDDRKEYSAWRKPAGLLSQGTDFGDHISLLRQVERRVAPRPVFLVHRLDREASGIMLVAHSSRMAAALSALFREGKVDKRYRVDVVGRVEGEGTIDLPLDGKPARTDYILLAHEEARNVSTLELRLHTGRMHQARRHMTAIGHPVVGDPRYGRGNKDAGGLRLVASALRYVCPVRGTPVELTLPAPDA